MSVVVYTFNAPLIAKVASYTFGGTWETSDVVVLTIGTKSVSVVAGSTTITTIIDTVVSAWNALSETAYPEFAEITASRSGSALILTADTAGKSFSVTITTTETGGGAADSQTIGVESITTANSGPGDASCAANYSGGALPSNSDTLVIRDSDLNIEHGLNALAAVTLAELIIDQSFTGAIGLPEIDADGGYYQYRGDYLQVGATLVTIGVGVGAGSGRMKLNLGSAQTTVNVTQTGQSQDGYKALILKGTHASNALNVLSGSVDVAPEEGNASTFATVRVSYRENVDSDADVRLGGNVTLTNIDQNGGTLLIQSNTTTIEQYAGTCILQEGDHASVKVYAADGATLDWRTDGEVTALEASNAIVDLSKDPRPKDFPGAGTIQLYRGAELRDPMGLLPSGTDVRDNTGGVTLKFPPRTYTVVP